MNYDELMSLIHSNKWQYKFEFEELIRDKNLTTEQFIELLSDMAMECSI
jgi:hypothetical protein